MLKNLSLKRIRLVFVAALSYLVFKYLFIPTFLSSAHMEPALKKGSYHLINTMKTPKKNDVIGVKLAGTSVILIYRVIAFPGDRVGILNGSIFINDKPYGPQKLKVSLDKETKKLDIDEYFVIADSIFEKPTLDPKPYGKIKKERILGVLLF